MPVTVQVRADSTEPLAFVVQQIDPDTGVVSAVNITGYQAVELRLRKRSNNEVIVFSTTDTPTSKLSVTAAATGQVTFSPASGDLDAGAVYDAYLRVLDSAGRYTSFPSDENMKVTVIESFAAAS